MNRLRGICIVYDLKDSYTDCYFKEFFKWIGVSYAECLYDADMSVFTEPGRGKFDVIVAIGDTLIATEAEKIAEVSGAKLIHQDSNNQCSDHERLKSFLNELSATTLSNEASTLLKELADIYKEYKLVSYLYAYTQVLFQKMDKVCSQNTYKILKHALSAVETFLNDRVSVYRNHKPNDFIANILYAKYNCQSIINEMLNIQNKSLEYNTEDYLNSINEIYDYDPDFFKVEFLKSKVAELDSMYWLYGKTYLESCIEECPIDLCKSFHYYGLAKWLERDEQLYASGKAYRIAYQKNPTNIKAIFKLAVDRLKKKENETAEILLKQIANMWDVSTRIKEISPRDLEYAYKVRMLLFEIDKTAIHYAEESDQILKFIQESKEGEMGDDNSFIEKLYPDKEFRREICDAMLQRLKAQCLDVNSTCK